MKFATKPIWHYPPHLRHVATLPWELTDVNCAARMRRPKLLLQEFPQYATDFVFFTDKKVFSVTSPDNRQNKSVADCGNFWRRSLAFSSVRSLRGLPLLGSLSTVPVTRNFLNSLLTSRFVQLFSGNSSVNLFAVYPFKYKLFLSKSCPRRLISCWLLTNTAMASAMTNFRGHKLIAKAK